ncbi:AbrB family transcriptional regulator [Hydrogenophaga sp. OTU3427]|uniref:AbrB family transcriptional regulator n=1 Tax=Hydrogenophaga sp. OTU3427 TaxID=3043856 RepID=UPI00313EA46E
MTFPRSSRVGRAVCVLATLALAWAAARLCVWLHTPIPWMIGPLLATALASLAGAPTASWTPLRNTGQWVIGTALGLYFTPQVGALVASLWWVIVLGIVWALLLGLGFDCWLQRVHARHLPGLSAGELRATTYFSGAIGGASEMTLLAERAGARTDLVASAHSLRVLLVTLCLPFGMLFWGVTGLDLAPPAVRDVAWPGLGLLALLTLAGAVLAQWLGRANPWFMGALLVTMGITLSGQVWSALPPELSYAAQLVIGVSLGVRFTPDFLHTAPRWLGSVALASVVMMVLCAAFGWGLSRMIGMHPATMVLGTAPGGIAEMSITAKVLQLGVPVVTAFQVCRLVAVLVLAEPVYRLWVVRQQQRRHKAGVE